MLSTRTKTALVLGLFFLGCGPQGSSGPGAGAAAPLFLRSSPFTSMVIEVTPVAGRDPDPKALATLLARAQQYCRKPGGVTLVVDPDVPLPDAGPHAYTLSGLQVWDMQHQLVQGTRDTIVLHVLYMDGVLYGNNGDVLGVSFRPGAFAVFKDALLKDSPQLDTLEAPTLVHELGHQLGLVDGGSPMTSPHEDPAHPGHDANPACVMFFQLEGQELALRGIAPADDYDAACQADLRAASGK